MIVISKDEAMALRERFGADVGITITSRHKRGGRKKYYAEEGYRVQHFLEIYREKRARRVNAKRGAR